MSLCNLYPYIRYIFQNWRNGGIWQRFDLLDCFPSYILSYLQGKYHQFNLAIVHASTQVWSKPKQTDKENQSVKGRYMCPCCYL